MSTLTAHHSHAGNADYAGSVNHAASCIKTASDITVEPSAKPIYTGSEAYADVQNAASFARLHHKDRIHVKLLYLLKV